MGAMTVTDHQALDLHIQAVHFEAQMPICSAKLPTLVAPLRDAFSKWRVANAAALQQGATVAANRGMSGSRPPSLAHMANMQAQILSALPLDDMRRRCHEVLDELSLGK